MKGISLTIAAALLAALPLAGNAAPAAKPPAKPAPKPKAGSQLPAGTVESGVINVDQLSKLQNLTILVKGAGDDATKAVKMRTILPEGWTYEEGGRKKNSAELDPNAVWYTLVAKPPTASKETDFVYELRVRTFGLTERLDEFKDASGKPLAIKDKTPEGMLALYMNGMITEFAKAGYKSNTKTIKRTAYGVIPDDTDPTGKKMMLMGSRPEPMYYAPIRFTQPKTGETVYTFTGVVGQKLVSMRFLVAKDQNEYYESTIALILNNTWGLTMDQDAAWAQKMAEKIKAGEAAAQKNQKNKGGKPN
jgi:hypothetical protein